MDEFLRLEIRECSGQLVGEKNEGVEGKPVVICLEVSSQLSVFGQLHDDPDGPSHGAYPNQLDDVLVVELLHDD